MRALVLVGTATEDCHKSAAFIEIGACRIALAEVRDARHGRAGPRHCAGERLHRAARVSAAPTRGDIAVSARGRALSQVSGSAGCRGASAARADHRRASQHCPPRHPPPPRDAFHAPDKLGSLELVQTLQSRHPLPRHPGLDPGSIYFLGSVSTIPITPPPPETPGCGASGAGRPGPNSGDGWG